MNSEQNGTTIGTVKTTITTKETQSRSQKSRNFNSSYKYYTQMETEYEALERVEKTTYYTTYLEEREITSIDGTITSETAWYKVPNSEQEFKLVEMYEIKGTKDQNYIHKHYNCHGCSGTHYHYFGVNYHSPFFGLEDRFIRRIYKKGSSLPIEENKGNWNKLTY